MSSTQPLSAEDLTAFHERGFLVVRDFIDSDTVAHLQDETDGLHALMEVKMKAQGEPKLSCSVDGTQISWEEGTDGWRIRQLMNSEVVSPTIHAILHSDRMLATLRQLMDVRDVVKYHSKLMMKPAGDGSFTPWHQDWGYWQSASNDPSQINCMLSIDAATLENGCIRFVEGSQKDGPIDHKKFNASSFNIGLDGDIEGREATPVETGPGDAVFFGPLVVHGSAANNSPHQRRANTFAFDKAGNQKNGLELEQLGM